jgi:peptidoglycan hydrolase-like protein with peptidoglycan-binding domain
MFRSVWAAAGASVFAFVLSPGAALAAGGGGLAARSADAHANQDRHHRHAASAVDRGRGAAARAAGGRRLVLLAPGSGYRLAGGSGRVRALQRRLAAAGFMPGPIDGRYGPLTTAAVERFQRADRLAVDGVAGVRTLAALRTMSRAVLVPGAGYRQAGGAGRVRVLQRRLAASGFMPGLLDGRYGPVTTAAVERFQDAHGLPVDGILSARMLAALISASGHRTAIRSPKGARVPRAARVPQGARVPRRARVPRSARVPLPGRLPLAHRVPSASSTSSNARAQHPAPLPVTGVLTVLALLGLATVALSYGRTRARVRAEHASAYHSTRSTPPPHPHAQRPVVRDLSSERGGGER